MMVTKMLPLRLQHVSWWLHPSLLLQFQTGWVYIQSGRVVEQQTCLKTRLFAICVISRIDIIIAYYICSPMIISLSKPKDYVYSLLLLWCAFLQCVTKFLCTRFNAEVQIKFNIAYNSIFSSDRFTIKIQSNHL